MDAVQIKSLLVNENHLSELIYFDELDSTNAFCKSHNPADNTLVITTHQTGGTGRFGRPWRSLKDLNLTFTLVKCFRITVDEIHLVNFYSSYILFLTMKELLEDHDKVKNYEISLKWPNDLLINRKKIAGILLDVKDLKNEIKKFIIGIGVNVNQKVFDEEIKFKATSWYAETKQMIEPEKILVKFIQLYYKNLDLITSKVRLMELWINNSGIKGKEIQFKQLEDDSEKKATVINIDEDGGLRVKFDDGHTAKFFSGEIRLVYN